MGEQEHNSWHTVLGRSVEAMSRRNFILSCAPMLGFELNIIALNRLVCYTIVDIYLGSALIYY